MESIFILAGAVAIFLGFTYWSLGISRIQYCNYRKLKSLRRKIGNPDTEGSERSACRSILITCNDLSGKWILDEKDLNILEKTMNLIDSIASAWKPRSSAPIMEASLGSILKAACELNLRLEQLTRLRGIRSATRFRIRHVLLLAKVLEKKRSFEGIAVIRFLRRTRLDFVIQWVYAALRFYDFSFWTFKMTGYVVQDVWFKILLVHFYLTVGELAGNIYREKEERDSEPLIDQIEEVPEVENLNDLEWPEDLKMLIRKSRYEILLHTGTTGWKEFQTIYLQLVLSIARYYYPKADQPLHEARLYSLLASATRVTENVAALETVPVVQKLLGVKLIHLMRAKETVDWLSDNQVMEWIKEHGFHKAVSYASVLFQVIKRRHPAVLLKEFAWMLTKEGVKRWAIIYAHQKIADEARLIYSSDR